MVLFVGFPFARALRVRLSARCRPVVMLAPRGLLGPLCCLSVPPALGSTCAGLIFVLVVIASFVFLPARLFISFCSRLFLSCSGWLSVFFFPRLGFVVVFSLVASFSLFCCPASALLLLLLLALGLSLASLGALGFCCRLFVPILLSALHSPAFCWRVPAPRAFPLWRFSFFSSASFSFASLSLPCSLGVSAACPLWTAVALSSFYSFSSGPLCVLPLCLVFSFIPLVAPFPSAFFFARRICCHSLLAVVASCRGVCCRFLGGGDLLPSALVLSFCRLRCLASRFGPLLSFFAVFWSLRFALSSAGVFWDGSSSGFGLF